MFENKLESKRKAMIFFKKKQLKTIENNKVKPHFKLIDLVMNFVKEILYILIYLLINNILKCLLTNLNFCFVLKRKICRSLS